MRVQFPVTIFMKYMYIGADQTAGKEIIISIFIEVDYWTRDNLCESEIEKFVINLEEDSFKRRRLTIFCHVICKKKIKKNKT